MTVEGSVLTMGGVLAGPTRSRVESAGLKHGDIPLLKTKTTMIGSLGSAQKFGKVCSCFSKVFPIENSELIDLINFLSSLHITIKLFNRSQGSTLHIGP